MVAVSHTDIDMSLSAPQAVATLDELEQRLERGLRLIEDRAASGLATDRHEDHWLTLLREYETLYDALR